MRLTIKRDGREFTRRAIAVFAMGLVGVLGSPALVGAGGPPDPDLEGGNGPAMECQEKGITFEFSAKTNGGQVPAGTYNIPGGGTITFANAGAGQISFDSTVPVAAIIVKKGMQQDAVTTFDPPVFSGVADTNAPLDGEESPSHITICFGAEQPPPPPPGGDGTQVGGVTAERPGAAVAVTARPQFTG